MRSISLSVLAAATTLSLAACASNPPPEPTPPPQETAVVTPPRVTPPPPPPVTPPPPPRTGPALGSQADFSMKVTDDGRVFFGYDQYNLDDDDLRALATQVTWLKANPTTRVEVQGHADERGSQAYNIALGERRADAVSNYLKGQGITADRIQTISFGKDKPWKTGTGEEVWKMNRNAYTIVIREAGA
jgi:peptidoglycan-associated lipoprotein